MSEQLQTESLLLRASDGTVELRTLRPADAPRIFDLIEGDPENIKTYDPNAAVRYASPDTIRNTILQEGQTDLRSFSIWDVSEAEDDTMVGVIELNFWGQEGYTATWVGPAYRGRGYATRAARPLIDFAFNTLRLTRLIRTVNQDNIPSVRTTEKLGFTLQRINNNGLMTFILNRPTDHD